jgi:peroxiredoxin
MFKKLILLTVAMLFIAMPAFAIGNVKQGDSLPDISSKDQNGAMRNFNDLVGKNGMVLVFYRSADWCPYCKAQLIDLRDNKDKIEKEGYSLVGISYDSPAILKKFEMQQKPGFTLLSDPASKIIRQFGLFNEDFAKGTFAYGVPHPAVYVVGKDKKVQAVLAEEGYKDRPQASAIMKVIDDLKPKAPVVTAEDKMMQQEADEIMEEAKQPVMDESLEIIEESPMVDESVEEMPEPVEEPMDEPMSAPEEEMVPVEEGFGSSDTSEPEKAL